MYCDRGALGGRQIKYIVFCVWHEQAYAVAMQCLKFSIITAGLKRTAFIFS